MKESLKIFSILFKIHWACCDVSLIKSDANIFIRLFTVFNNQNDKRPAIFLVYLELEYKIKKNWTKRSLPC